MNTLPHPLTRDLVLVGGGHAHALVLRRWGMRPLPGARLTVINPGPTAPYTGMLPGHVAGHYPRAALDIDLVKLARFAGARLILGQATGLDRDARHVQVPGRPPIAYDVLSIDIGITSDLPQVAGFTEHGIAAKPLGPFADAWAAYLERDAPRSLVVIGGGIGGLELSMAMAHALRSRGEAAEVTVVEAGRAGSGLGDSEREKVMAEAARLGVDIRENSPARSMDAASVTLADGTVLPSTFTVGVGGARPHGWLADTGLALTDGFIDVGPSLQTLTDPDIFASGDCAHLTHAPRPKAGVFAVRAAPVLTHNLEAALTRGPMRDFRPQSDYLKLISLGAKRAFGQKWGLSVAAPWVWTAKDRIDRSFMERLSTLPRMPDPVPPVRAAKGGRVSKEPMCGGCGAKLGPGPLHRALAGLDHAARDDVLTGPGDDAAVLRVGNARQVITTDQLRAFCDDPYLMARITANHALGDVWAMGAAPQSALLTVTLPPMTEQMAERWLREILAGTQGAVAEAGAALVGGHTTHGAELAIGLTVTGLLDGPPKTLAGARPGDHLILTRPIGSGILLAAGMAGRAGGDDIAALWRAMAQGHGRSAPALSPAHAATDVTGFGLAGHLLAMLDASGVGATLWPACLPVYAGARDLAARGIHSTLSPANRESFAPRITSNTVSDPVMPLLFDPQTAGGLLAAVDPEHSADVMKALAQAGEDARIIGQITDGPPQITLTDAP